MKKLFFTSFLFLCFLFSSSAQTYATSKEFYSYLNSVLENKNTKSIQLLGTNYGDFGSKYNWSAKLNKDGKKIEIQYNSQKPSENDSIVMSLDTTFVTTQKKLIQDFKTEITAVETRPVYYEEIIKIKVNTETSTKEFTLKRADGLPFLLRYDMSFEAYYNLKKEE